MFYDWGLDRVVFITFDSIKPLIWMLMPLFVTLKAVYIIAAGKTSDFGNLLGNLLFFSVGILAFKEFVGIVVSIPNYLEGMLVLNGLDMESYISDHFTNPIDLMFFEINASDLNDVTILGQKIGEFIFTIIITFLLSVAGIVFFLSTVGNMITLGKMMLAGIILVSTYPIVIGLFTSILMNVLSSNSDMYSVFAGVLISFFVQLITPLYLFKLTWSKAVSPVSSFISSNINSVKSLSRPISPNFDIQSKFNMPKMREDSPIMSNFFSDNTNFSSWTKSEKNLSATIKQGAKTQNMTNSVGSTYSTDVTNTKNTFESKSNNNQVQSTFNGFKNHSREQTLKELKTTKAYIYGSTPKPVIRSEVKNSEINNISKTKQSYSSLNNHRDNFNSGIKLEGGKQ